MTELTFSVNLTVLYLPPLHSFELENSTCMNLTFKALRTWPWFLALGLDLGSWPWVSMYVLLLFQFNCCGVLGPSDYIYSSWFNHSKDADGLFVPASCCHLRDSDDVPEVDKDFDPCQAEAILYPRIKRHQRQHLKSRVNKFCNSILNVFIEWLIGWILVAWSSHFDFLNFNFNAG